MPRRGLGSHVTPQYDATSMVVTDSLQRLYKDKLLPIEKEHEFHRFHGTELHGATFSAKPMVLVLGPYSTGKSTFIKHLLGRDYPGLHIGPEPTTDKFVATVTGDRDQTVPGNAAVMDASLPFEELTQFGNGFLSRFVVSKLACPVLDSLTIVDSPGVLAGEKQRIKRGYEFEHVAKWFADRSDMILLLFDVSKTSISDEFRRVILAVRTMGNDHKIRIILNKADQVTSSELMRVYGAMMWTLREVIDTPEVVRVYIGSFWDEPLVTDELRRLFESEENDIYGDLAHLPRRVAIRKLNDVIKRTRLAKVHAYLLDHLRRKASTGTGCLSSICGRAKQRALIANLEAVYEDIAEENKLALGDFPDSQQMQDKLAEENFSRFAKVNKRRIEALDSLLDSDFPKLLQLISQDAAQQDVADLGTTEGASPFQVMNTGGGVAPSMTSAYQSDWLTAPNVEEYRADFQALGPDSQGKIGGRVAKSSMVKSKLPSKVLHQVWTLADVDKDGALTLYEYALAMHLIKMKQDGYSLPQTLPLQMHPAPLIRCHVDNY